MNPQPTQQLKCKYCGGQISFDPNKGLIADFTKPVIEREVEAHILCPHCDRQYGYTVKKFYNTEDEKSTWKKFLKLIRNL